MLEHYSNENPHRVVDEGLDRIGLQLGSACISFSLENDFCSLENLTETSKRRPDFPALRLYTSLNRLYWHNYEELEELGIKDVIEEIETEVIVHSDIGLEDAYRVNRIHSHLY